MGGLIPPQRPIHNAIANSYRINGQIRVAQVRLIMPDGSNRGVVDIQEAQWLARSMNLDLIEVAPAVSPPVCRIFDFGKFTYEREKKEREAKKAQKTIGLKGIRLRPKTTDHHLSFKIRAARRFLEQGNKVKITLRFKGREGRIPHVAFRMLEKMKEGCADISLVEVAPGMEGNAMLMVLAPNTLALAASKLKSTQTRLEAEREADLAAGFVEDGDDDDLDQDDDVFEHDDDEHDEKQSVSVEDRVAGLDLIAQAKAAKATVDFHDKKARSEFNKDKRNKHRQMEQFDLP
ncbi:MAG: translation initiation factor IF-3 [Chloroflexi bacterium]|nr:translation initiation factor IF-3 [Chloroflexota bacterium]